MGPTCPTLLLLFLAARAPLAAPAGGGRADEERAEELLAEAEFELEHERYQDAVRTLRLLARKYPDTEAGRLAARRSQPSGFLYSTLIVDHGPSTNRVDIALMGDGYTLAHQGAFDELAEDVPPLFERQETLREYYSYFNFRRFNLVSADDNVDGFGREEDTALGGYVRGTVQGHVAVDPRLVRAMLDEVPEHDGQAIVFVRTGVLGSGTPGIATIGGRDARTTIHELGHSFAGLADEYADHTHERGPLGRSPNVAATDDPDAVPWAHWIESGAPRVGVYQGAAGQVRGAWKPTSSGCVMERGEFFCPPCQEALVLAIHRYVDPIDSENHPPYPRDHPASLVVEDAFPFEVQVLRPRSHRIEVRWWVFPELAAPPEPEPVSERYARGPRPADRRVRGRLWPIVAEPDQESKGRKSGRHRFTLRASDHEPGRYRVVCRARDTTLLGGERLPWVLRDEHDLLQSERAWWVEIPPR